MIKKYWELIRDGVKLRGCPVRYTRIGQSGGSYDSDARSEIEQQNDASPPPRVIVSRAGYIIGPHFRQRVLFYSYFSPRL